MRRRAHRQAPGGPVLEAEQGHERRPDHGADYPRQDNENRGQRGQAAKLLGNPHCNRRRNGFGSD